MISKSLSLYYINNIKTYNDLKSFIYYTFSIIGTIITYGDRKIKII